MIAMLAVCILAMSIMSSADASRQSTPAVRKISHSTRSIPLQLRSDDEIVVVERDDEGVSFEGPVSLKGLIQYTLSSSDLVAVFRVHEVDALLVEDQTWIHTRVFAEIDQLIVSRLLSFSPGQRLEIQSGGGELRIGRVLVKAGKSLKVQRERRYLMFLRLEQQANVLFPTSTPLLVEEKLSNPWQSEGDSKTRDPLHGLALQGVIELIRRYDKQP